MSDLFHESLSDHFIAAVFGAMAASPSHTFQILTKRPQRMRAWFEWAARDDAIGGGVNTAVTALFGVPDANAWLTRNDNMNVEDCEPGTWDHLIGDPPEWPLRNVWLGVSVEDQQRADERIPLLLRTPAAVRFLSCEPLLGPVDMRREFIQTTGRNAGIRSTWLRSLDWVIVGGESGRDARPCNVEWLRSIVRQCREASVPVFVKQLGAVPVERFDDQGVGARDLGSLEPIRLRHTKGGDPAEWPADLRVREWPKPVEIGGSTP